MVERPEVRKSVGPSSLASRLIGLCARNRRWSSWRQLGDLHPRVSRRLSCFVAPGALIWACLLSVGHGHYSGCGYWGRRTQPLLGPSSLSFTREADPALGYSARAPSLLLGKADPALHSARAPSLPHVPTQNAAGGPGASPPASERNKERASPPRPSQPRGQALSALDRSTPLKDLPTSTAL